MESAEADVLSRQSVWTSETAILAYIALANLALYLIAIPNYGYFRDELYYLACSDHLALGYVDHPAFSILILKAVRFLFGSSLVAIRIVPALLAAGVTFMTGRLARELGGDRFAVVLAALTGFARIGIYPTFHFYSMNAWDHVFWLACLFALVRLLKTREPKYWLLFGLAAGIGFENKISVLFLGFGVAAGFLATRDRSLLKSRFFWGGAGIAGLLAVPYVLWNLTHGLATVEFMGAIQGGKNTAVSPLQFLLGQVLWNNPATALVWIAGLWFILFHRNGKRYRPLGLAFGAIYVLFTILHAKDYYLAPFYPLLVAAGAVAWERGLRKRRGSWARIALPAFLLAATVVLGPLAYSILPVDQQAAFIAKAGFKSRNENTELGPLPQHMADMFGWEEMVAQFAAAYQGLNPQERAHCLIYVRNYGEAGAVDFLGRKYGLPRAYCGHNNYWFWGPPDWNGDAAIIIGTSKDPAKSRADLEAVFESVELAATMYSKYAMPFENGRQIYVCRKRAKFSWKDQWPREKRFI